MGDYKEFDETLLENGVLKNKLGITDERELRKKEYTIVAKRSLNFYSSIKYQLKMYLVYMVYITS